jgi:ABC-type sugar transport system ATPase subunit
MLGRPASLAFPPKQPPPPDSPVELEAVGLERPPVINDVSLSVRRGEIVGLAGLVGSGRTELVRAIFGADKLHAGVVHIKGDRVDRMTPRVGIRKGLVMLPESRKDQGLFLTRSVRENLTMAYLADFTKAGVVMTGRERKAAIRTTRDFDIKAPSLRAPVNQLSGGNQQRVLFARWLLRTPRILIVDEPTRGIDVGAKRAIYELIVDLAASGMAVLLVSSELEEVLGLSHRVLVIRDGRIVGEFQGESLREAPILAAAFGADHEARA